MKTLLLAALLCAPLSAQQTVRWAATTGDVVLSSAATAATVQQPATGASQVIIDQVVVYCSVACTISQAANGTAATATAGTVTPILPTPLNVPLTLTFWTASNVGGGTTQGGVFHLAAGATVVLCLSRACGNAGDVVLGTGGTGANYTVSIAAITGTANTTFYGRAQ